jgi:hypothetical protein
LVETFTNMRRAGLKLNPEKCVFGVTKGKVLGCLISAKRIEANPDKIRAIREMEEPKTKKDIQKLNGRVAALNRFISRSAERSLPFFKALKGKGVIEWGPEQSKAFAEFKDYIEKMAILSPPSPSEPQGLYRENGNTIPTLAFGATPPLRSRLKSCGQRCFGPIGRN